MIHIAICEDDPIYLHELEKTIKETKGLSAEIHPCSSPEERSKLYGKNFVPYDIVLMDIELPEKSGIILSKKSCRQTPRHRLSSSHNIANTAVMCMRRNMYILFISPMLNNICLVRLRKQSSILSNTKITI